MSRLAREGVRFEHCYAQPNCTPTRVQLLTGMSNVRNYVDFGTLEGLVGRVSTGQMKSLVADPAADLKPYGLDKPAYQLEFVAGSDTHAGRAFTAGSDFSGGKVARPARRRRGRR